MKTNTIFGALWLSGVLFTNILFSQETVTYEDFPKGKMMLVGIPLNFDNADPGAVLEPEFGEQFRSGEPTPYWRFSRWSVADQTYLRYGEAEHTWDHEAQAYTTATEQGSPPDIAPGVGYWLAQGTANTVTDFSLTGSAIDPETPAYVTLNPPDSIEGHSYPGLNMLANPFLYAIDWKNTQVRINDNTEVSLEQAVNMGLVSQYSYSWDGDQYTPYNMTDGGVLDVWDGFWAEQMNPEVTDYVVYDVTVSSEGENGGGDDCGTCPDEDIGQMKYLKLRYNGTMTKWIKITDNHGYYLFRGEVQPGAEFEFYGVQNKQSMGPRICLWTCTLGYCCYCFFDCEIHTSCSVPIGPGQTWGSFTIMEAISKNDVVMCPIESAAKPVIEFSDAHYTNSTEADLGDGGAIETDRLVVTLTNTDNDEIYFRTYTVNDDSTDWIALTEVGAAVADGQGFTVTLVEENGGEYTFDVTGTGIQTAALEAVKFRFGDDQTIQSPTDGSTYTSARTLLDGQAASLELKIPAIDVGGQLAKAADKPTFPIVAESASEWVIPLRVSSIDGQLIDNFNALGVKEGASDMFDPLDARNFAPNLGAYVDLYFPHHEESDRFSYWPQKPMKASIDIRSAADAIIWNFRMTYYNTPEQQFVISWDASQFPASDKELVLINEQTEERIDMLAVSEYSVTTPSDDYGNLYFVVAAFNKEEGLAIDHNVLSKADNFRLFANYPNPFNARTRIYYSLPKEADVQLQIYSLNGRLITTLVNNRQSSGYYGFDWDGTDYSGVQVASGIYIYSLRADQRVESRKMILMK